MPYKNKEQKSPQKRFLFIFGLLIFVCYLTLGVGLIVYKNIFPQIENPYRWIFAVLLIVYAAFRFIRLLQTRD
jgi:cytochrome c biogenesis protein CcdA